MSPEFIARVSTKVGDSRPYVSVQTWARELGTSATNIVRITSMLGTPLVYLGSFGDAEDDVALFDQCYALPEDAVSAMRRACIPEHAIEHLKVLTTLCALADCTLNR